MVVFTNIFNRLLSTNLTDYRPISLIIVDTQGFSAVFSWLHLYSRILGGLLEISRDIINNRRYELMKSAMLTVRGCIGRRVLVTCLGAMLSLAWMCLGVLWHSWMCRDVSHRMSRFWSQRNIDCVLEVLSRHTICPGSIECQNATSAKYQSTQYRWIIHIFYSYPTTHIIYTYILQMVSQ